MRLIAGMLLGAALTAAVAYYHDTRPGTSRTMVNWDVVDTRWNGVWSSVKERARAGWADLTARIDRS